MQFFHAHKLMSALVLAVMIICLWVGFTQATLEPDSAIAILDRITALDIEKSDRATTLVIQGNGRMPAVATRTIANPPRIIIDLLAVTPRFKSIQKQVSDPNLKSIRVGHHPAAIRLVLDIGGPEFPRFSTTINDRKLVVRLTPFKLTDEQNLKPESRLLSADTRTQNNGASNAGSMVAGSPDRIQELDESKSQSVVDSVIKNESMVSENIFDAAEELTRLNTDDQQIEISAFITAVVAYRAHNWQGTIDHLRQFIQTSPATVFVEKAHFLLAKAYDRMHADELYSRYNEILGYYEDAIYQYPDSPYLPDAYVSIGNLCFRSEIYSEALGYYNLVIEMDQLAHATVTAQLKKALIFSVRKKKKAALEIYASVVQQYPGLPGTIKAKVGMAVIMFDLNQFGNALNILVDLGRHPEYAYTYPDILYYLGNIYYQMGSFAKAREHLFRYYNSFPDKENSPLVLARIADAYREVGLAKEAILFYQLVLKRYPQSEGALISMYRLADMQENGDLAIDQGMLPKITVLDATYDMPRKLYEDVIKNAFEKNESTPLLQFAFLKLSILDQREQKFEDSLSRLKDLLKRYPRTNLKREIEIAYGKTLVSIMEKNLRVKKYKHVINIYQAEKAMIERLNTPEIYVNVARAALRLGLVDLGAEMFEQASLHLPDSQKPSDLIFYVGRAYYRWGEFEQAIRYLDLLLSKRPVDQFTSEAWSLKGQIHFTNGEYDQSAKMFANALKHSTKSCDRKDLLMYRAKALLKKKSKQAALQMLAEAENAVASCLGKKSQMYADIGKLYLQLGKPEKALAVITIAHDMENDSSSKVRFKIEMARCYEHMNQKDSYLAIYTEVANQDDPFWRNVAREKMEAINFKTIRSEMN